MANPVDPISVLLANSQNLIIQKIKQELIALLQVQRNKEVSEMYVAKGVEVFGVLPKEGYVSHVIPEDKIGYYNAQGKIIEIEIVVLMLKKLNFLYSSI